MVEIVAEIGINHNGSLTTAKDMIDEADSAIAAHHDTLDYHMTRILANRDSIVATNIELDEDSTFLHNLITFRTTAGVTRNEGGDYTADDFVFGSPSLNYSGIAAHSKRFFFDKGQGAFRGGYNGTAAWDNANLGEYSFAEMVARVHHSMRIEVDARELGRQLARNVGAERNPLIRVAPLPVKDLVLSIARRRLAERVYSGVLSNLGKVSVPESIDAHVESFGFAIVPSLRMKKNCAILSFRDDLQIAIGSVIESRELERRFFSALVREGVSVKVGEC